MSMYRDDFYDQKEKTPDWHPAHMLAPLWPSSLALDEFKKHILKLRWMGMDGEAECSILLLGRDAPAGNPLIGPFDTN